MNKKIIGRDASCDYVIFDPQNRVSRKHAELYFDTNFYYIKDLGSLNGTFINGSKIPADKVYKLRETDKITLSTDYKINPQQVFLSSDPDATQLLQLNNNIVTDSNSSSQFTFFVNNKTVVFDKDKTQLSDIVQMDQSPFVSIGRSSDNVFVINSNSVSKCHCKVRLLTPVMIEIEDLNSTNGTFADGVKLTANKRYQFSSAVEIKLGLSVVLDLKKVLPSIHIIKKEKRELTNPVKPTITDNNPTKHEMKLFNDLEEIWNEYQIRQNHAVKSVSKYAIAGSVAGIVASALLVPVTGGISIGSMLAMSGGGLLGRYLGQQKSNNIKSDLTYESMFLETYCCPRCKESFQKKPWITIRECMRCKTKYR